MVKVQVVPRRELTPQLLLRLRNRPLHSLCEEGGEGLNIEIDARAVECTKIARTILDPHDRPGIAARGQHGVHQKASHSTIAIHVGMYVPNEPVTEYGSDRWLSF